MEYNEEIGAWNDDGGGAIETHGYFEVGADHDYLDMGPIEQVGAENIHTMPVNIRVPKDFAIGGKLKWWVKDDKFYGSVCVSHKPSGSRLCITACTPLAPIRKWVEQSIAEGGVDVGWDVWGSIKKAGSWLGKQAKRVASSNVVKKITAIATNPAVTSALTGGMSIPITSAIKATGLLGKAQSGVAGAKQKIANITQLAGQGNSAAMALWNFMSQMYRNPTQLQQFQQQYVNPMVQRYMPQQMQQYMPQMQQYMPQRQMMQVPILPTGMPWPVQTMTPQGFRVSGWLYNVPYRSNLSAMELDSSNPSAILRNVYYEGLHDETAQTVSWP